MTTKSKRPYPPKEVVREYECTECEWSGTSEDMKGIGQIHHIAERISPGEICPLGECPECGALIQVPDDEIPDYLVESMQHIAADRARPVYPGLPAADLFTVGDRLVAEREGWGMCYSHGAPEIAHDAEAGVWDSDDDVIDYVRKCAAAGVETHRRAIVIHDRYAALIEARAHGRPDPVPPVLASVASDGRNAGQPWTAAEDEELGKLFAHGWSVPQMAAVLHRTEAGIIARCLSRGYRVDYDGNEDTKT